MTGIAACAREGPFTITNSVAMLLYPYDEGIIISMLFNCEGRGARIPRRRSSTAPAPRGGIEIRHLRPILDGRTIHLVR